MIPTIFLPARLTEYLARWKNLSETAKLAISAVALIVLGYLAIKLLSGIGKLLEWLQQLYWDSSTNFKAKYKKTMYALLGVSLGGLILIAASRAALWVVKKFAWIAEETYQRDDQYFVPAAYVVYAVLGITLVLLFFVSWCKGQRAEIIEKFLEAGDLVKALSELEALRSEPGQNISVDARVACLHAYALLMAGHEDRALECLQQSEQHLSGSRKFQELFVFSSMHRLRYNVESIEMMKLRIASLLCELGRFYEAARLAEEKVSQTTTDLARLNVRGVAVGGMGRLREAEQSFLSALDESRLYSDDENVKGELRSIRRNLGQCLLLQHRYGEARRLIEQARAERAAHVNPGHPDLIDCECLLARVRAGQGRSEEACSIFETAMANETRFLAMSAAGMREADMLRLVRRMQVHFEQYISHVAENHASDPQRLRTAFGHALRRKGLALQASAWSRKLSMTSGPSGLRLQQVRRELSDLLFATSGGHTFAAQQKINQLDQERKELEAAMAREASEETMHVLLEDVTVDAVRAAVPQNGVLVEFIANRINDSRTPEREGRLHYLAFVLSPSSKSPDFFDLGPAEFIDARALEFLRCMETYSDNQSRATDWRGPARELCFHLIEPLIESIDNAQQLIISPDAGLNFVPFATLIYPGERFFIERWQVGVISSGRDLVQRPTPRPSFTETPALLAGDPTFDVRLDGGSDRRRRRERARGLGAHPVLASAITEQRTYFAPLPATREEIEAIAEMFEHKSAHPKVLLGKDASKNRVAEAQSPLILHLATHAFFLPSLAGEAQSDASGFTSSIGFGSTDRDTPFGGLRGIAVSPYVRSGLALAGASNPASAGSSGLLTAEEVLSMNLTGTDLVVLSACQTAIGLTMKGEGVQGLHRAFLIAGARNVVASLWKVSDDKTMRLMRSFYAQYLQTTRKSEALRSAMLDLIAELKNEPDGPHPALWGAFVCFGPPDA